MTAKAILKTKSDGQVKNLYATVRRYVYDNINPSQFDKVYAGVNSEFKEIVWLYASKESTDRFSDSREATSILAFG